MPYAHMPVLWEEVRDFFAPVVSPEGGVLVDCTLGEGGHSELLLRAFPKASIIAFERDAEILNIAQTRLLEFSHRIEYVNANFMGLGERLGEMKGKVAGFLYDFGISSYHFDRSGRGFSFRADEPLDMRLDGKCGMNARDILERSSEMELTEIISVYGEERWARRIARSICSSREKSPIETTGELARIVLRAIPARFHVKNIHPATRVFQALRIAVNDELSAIGPSLRAALDLAAPGGRICAISFHSLEDRIVKNAFRRAARGCACEEKECRCNGAPLVRVLTKKPVVPGDAEAAANKRARSAKLRVVERL